MTTPEVVLVAATGDGESANAGGVVELLRSSREHPDLAGWWLSIVEAPELRIEHALELTRADLVLFVTEEPGGAGPLTFRRIEHATEHRIAADGADGEAISPEDVLHALLTLSRREHLPPSFALTIGRRNGAQSKEDSEGSTDAPFDFLLDLLRAPDAQRWSDRARGAGSGKRVDNCQAG